MGCRNATVLNAHSDEVWNALRDFHDLSWSQNVVEDVTKVGDTPGTEAGAKRVLNGAFHETLHEVDDSRQYFRYSIDDGPGPVAKGKVQGYFGEVSVLPVTAPDGVEQTVVVWTSDWDSEEGGVHEFCDPVYKALLNDLYSYFS